jgi:hypothetical protein
MVDERLRDQRHYVADHVRHQVVHTAPILAAFPPVLYASPHLPRIAERDEHGRRRLWPRWRFRWRVEVVVAQPSPGP